MTFQKHEKRDLKKQIKHVSQKVLLDWTLTGKIMSHSCEVLYDAIWHARSPGHMKDAPVLRCGATQPGAPTGTQQ